MCQVRADDAVSICEEDRSILLEAVGLLDCRAMRLDIQPADAEHDPADDA